MLILSSLFPPTRHYLLIPFTISVDVLPPPLTDGERSYTEVKCLGDGSFGTVWLCDWHSPVKKDVLLSAMQCGAGARPEWVGKRLVALKKMKRVWDGGWGEAKNLGELAVSERPGWDVRTYADPGSRCVVYHIIQQ